MNFIAAFLLLNMDPSRAFWTFCAIIEDILPDDYYTIYDVLQDHYLAIIN